ncbi:MAG: sporulation protein [Gammaproteobacteria bacterium]|nr:sporulation protein [Gammaproteobacteria bacterium]
MDEKLKQRLVGAAVIVALAAIFIPMILEGPVDGMGPIGSNLPPAPEYKVKDRLEPLVLPPPPAESDSASAAAEVPQAPEATLPEPAPAAEPEPEPTPEPEPAPAPDPAPAAEPAPAQPPAAASTPASGWVVQVASFSQQANAERLRDQLQAKGYKAFVESASTGAGTTWRVRVGPVSERPAAEKIQGEIAKAFDLKGLVAEYP